YYQLINISKRQLFNVFTFAKLCSQLSGRGEKPYLAACLTKLNYATPEQNPISPVGTWSGDRIVLIGDYSEGVPPFLTVEEGMELKACKEPGQEDHISLYGFAEQNYHALDVGDLWREATLEELGRQFPKAHDTHHLVLNLDKKEYLDPASFEHPQINHEGPVTCMIDFAREQHGVMRGLYSLLFYSTGEGGGDIEEFRIGSWAGNRISIEEKENVENLDQWVDISIEVDQMVKDLDDDD
ncbi:hypothetical protein BGZ50_004790, partial [Haplosporangium sp. Z 11]